MLERPKSFYKSFRVLFGCLLFNLFVLSSHSQVEFTAFLLVDSSENCDLTKVIDSKDFIPMQSPHFYSNFTKSTFWIKIVPSNLFSQGQRINFSNSLNHYETIHFVNINGQIKSHDFGTNQNYSSSTFLPSYPIKPDIKTIFIQIKSHTFLTESFSIDEEKVVLMRSSQYTVLQIFCLGFVFLIFTYISLIYFQTKRKILGKYAQYVFSAWLMFFLISNAGRYFLWNQLPFSVSYLEGIFTWLMVITYLNLTLNVTKIKEFYPWLHKVAVSYLYIGSVLVILVVSFSTSDNISKLANILPAFALIMILVFSLISLKKRNKNAGIYLIGIFAFIEGTVLRLMINWGIVDYSIKAELAVYFGVLTELVLFTYVVIKHVESQSDVNTIDKEKLFANAQQIERLKLSIQNLRLEIDGQKENNEITEEINLYLKSPLTKRELEVLIELSKGGQHNEVADRLFISVTTLKSHVSKVYTKLDSKNRIDAINTARDLISKQ